MPRFKDHRLLINFYAVLKKTSARNGAVAMPRKAYGDNSMSQNMVHYYHKMFWDGRENAEDEDLSRCPYTSHSNQNVEKLRDTLTSDRRQIVKMLGSPEKALKQSDTLQQYLASSA